MYETKDDSYAIVDIPDVMVQGRKNISNTNSNKVAFYKQSTKPVKKLS